MVHLIGNAHLDPAWMWSMDEGLEAFAATCRSALDRIQEFPEFIFTCSSAAHYEFLEETDPPLFARIQDAVRADSWSIAGGWWVEADCNLPSGESFVRQALLGQRYFESRFGKIATVGYNIDSFGHNANLPQLLRKSGIKSYVFMRPEQHEKDLEAALFLWEAPSGDQVTAYRLPLHYSNSSGTVRDKLADLPEYSLYRSDRPWMIFYGVGNHGGGPTIQQLRQIEELKAKQSDIAYSDPERFFASINPDQLPVIDGEMQPHAIGCYSAHSEIKQLHRRAENTLLMAERIAVLGNLLDSSRVMPSFEQAWKNLCFNQFHDLLGGVAIREACDDANSMYRETISIAERNIRTELQRIASSIDTQDNIENLIIFNPSAFAREEAIEFELWNPDTVQEGVLHSVALIAADGMLIATQRIEPSGKIGEDRVRFVAIVSIPPMGWAVYGIERHAKVELLSDVTLQTGQLSNGPATFIHPIEENIEPQAKIPSLNRLNRYIEHFPAIIHSDSSDTWAHGLHAFRGHEKEFEYAVIEAIEKGPVRGGIRICSSSDDAWLEEEYFVSKGSPCIDVRVYLQTQEKRSIIKLRFPHRCKFPIARYEIPYASIERPIGPNEWPGQTWVDVSERDGSRGLALITDSKYSYSIDDEFIYVIIARSPLYAYHDPPHVTQRNERERYLDQGVQEFRMMLIPHEGDWRSADLQRCSEQLHRPLIIHAESSHAGNLPRTFSGFLSATNGIQIGTIKQAEDGDGIIVRAVEYLGMNTSALFRFPSLNLECHAAFTPFEIKTFRISGKNITEVDFLERPL
jgi:alpha-mannosidase